MKKAIIITMITVSITSLTSCGFHRRSLSQIPVPLHTLNIQSANPASPVAATLKDTLQGMGVILSTNAMYTLNISRSTYTHSENSITNTSSAETYRFAQHVTASLSNHKGIVLTRTFTASNSEIVNKNQILTPSTTLAAQQSLPRQIVSQMYVWLTSQQVHQGLYGPQTTTTH